MIARVASNFTPDAVLALLQRRVVLVATEDQLIVATAALDGNVVRSVSSTRHCKGRASAGY